MSGHGTPWLSVLMPVYNGASMLRATLSSVADQAEGVEVILVDQGSTDGSARIAAEFADRIDLRLVAAPENENWVQNTNLALRLARAPRATLLHQDDLWRPGRAALLRRMFAAHPDAALWLHGADYVDGEGRVIGRQAPPLGARRRAVAASEVLSLLMVQNTVALPAAAFPVAAARAMGGLDEGLWYTADWDFWLALAGRGETAWDPARGVAFRLHGGSLTVSGSADLADFAAQLDTPPARHAGALAPEARDRVLAMARASNTVNLWLASVFHGSRGPVWPPISAFLSLGPPAWLPFLSRTRLVQRVRPRLRLMGRRRADG
ncbi:glycosyltransferase [Roseibacterium sp. SDUM158017]|uniref:glycosyltransferase family 2 protein n=1 Tax=Roseicyclus salinarum TaxID=3036773 RepID=UPI0024151E4F|nr:glycosyltransferase [Roseibacterium sp. SDUM158017]MDG4650161.1 glycosyltransferase [Roseibacterium sp. SDUM158017]